MPRKRQRSPGEKKALSYAKDRRNSYRANDKASRKAIPLRKAKSHRADRRKAAGALAAYETFDEETAALTENALVNDTGRVERWAKCPDQALADHIADQQWRRAHREGRKQWVRMQYEQAKKKGHTSFGWSWSGTADKSWFTSD
jgi:hypothetical protein